MGLMASTKQTLADVFKSHDTLHGSLTADRLRNGATRTPHQQVADHITEHGALSHADSAQLIGRECLIEYHGAPINGTCIDIQTPYNQVTYHIEITFNDYSRYRDGQPLPGMHTIKIRDGVRFWGGK
jgi:hypothetical protein